MKPMHPSPSTNLIASADLFNIVAHGEWVLQGDALRLTKQPELRTTSLAVATVFGKLHKNVLQSIANMECSEEFSRLNFKPANYLDEQGKPRSMVEMTSKGFEFLVLGFTGKKAAMFREAYIERFHSMEAELVKKTSEIERLARFHEHMPYLNVLEITGRKAVNRRIKNPDFKPIQEVEIAQAARGEGDYFVM